LNAEPQIDLAIVGAGIAGSTLKRLASEAGRDVVLIDGQQQKAASRAALCVLRRSWQTGEQRRRLEWTMRWYADNGWISATEAIVTQTNGNTIAQKDWTLIDPLAPLIEPDIASHVVRIDHDSNTVFTAAGETVRAGTIIVCAGPDSSKLSAPHDKDRSLWGHTAVAQGSWIGCPIRVCHIGPYRSIIAVESHGTTRLGSSKHQDRHRSLEAIHKMIDEATKRGMVPADAPWEILEGERAVHPADTGAPRRTGERSWRLSGFARCGYSLAPARASELLGATGIA